MAARKTPLPPPAPVKTPLLSAAFIAKYAVVSEGLRLTAGEVTMVAELAGIEAIGRGGLLDPVAVREAFHELAACTEHGDKPASRIRRTSDGWYSSCVSCWARDRGALAAAAA